LQPTRVETVDIGVPPFIGSVNNLLIKRSFRRYRDEATAPPPPPNFVAEMSQNFENVPACFDSNLPSKGNPY